MPMPDVLHCIGLETGAYIMFKNNFKVLYRVSSFLLCMLAIPAHAVSIGFSPASPTVSIGEFFDVDVVISELGIGDAPSVGVFNFDIDYIPTVLSADTVSFGSDLGGNSLTQAFDLSTLGFVNFAEISLLPPDILNTLQPDSFTLATLTFEAIGLGQSLLSFPGISIQDALAVDLTVTLETGGNVTVQPAAAVPEPNAIMLFGIGIFTMAVSRKRKQSLLACISNLQSPGFNKA